jgi:TPR repeat protein
VAAGTTAIILLSLVALSKLPASQKQLRKEAEALRRKADAGHAGAMYQLGVRYANGRGGLAKDDAQALDWYRKAAEAGHADALHYLQLREEVEALRRKAEAGDANGMTNLGVMYQNGQGGLAKDETQAVIWYRKAAEAGNTNGMTNLGFMYQNGQGGLEKDDTQAVIWYRKAAEAGNAIGMSNLGSMYQNGEGGLAKDDAQAVIWYRKAAEAGSELAKSNLRRMGR